MLGEKVGPPSTLSISPVGTHARAAALIVDVIDILVPITLALVSFVVTTLVIISFSLTSFAETSSIHPENIIAILFAVFLVQIWQSAQADLIAILVRSVL